MAAIASTALAVILVAESPAEAGCDQDTVCSGGPARIVFILDASSTMLNDGNAAGAMGQTDWDLFRQVLADPGESFFDFEIEPAGPVVSQIAHVGVVVYGADGEEKRLFQYAPCSEPNARWALDPETSCADPGCTDPWSGPEITWTFLDGSQDDPPGFAIETLSHMPRCQGGGPECTGSDRFTHRGADLVHDARAAYEAATPYVHDDTTTYVNILVTDGMSDSMPAEVQAALEAEFDAGVTTYVVGFGQGATNGSPQFTMELQDLADWGSGGALDAWEASNQGELQDALRDIVSQADLPCCQRIDCADQGGADDGGGTDSGAAEWGSADGSGTADGSADGGTGGSAGGEGIDDDGGCSCAAARDVEHRGGMWALLLLPLLRRRRSC
jgi:hypothetical protein